MRSNLRAPTAALTPPAQPAQFPPQRALEADAWQPLQPVLLTPADFATFAARHPARVLGAVRYGNDALAAPLPALTVPPGPAALADPSTVQAELVPLAEPWVEVFLSAQPVTHLRRGRVALSYNEDVLFTSLDVAGAAGEDIERQTFEAYAELLPVIEAAGYPHLMRAWNYVPHINAESQGLERYKLFCKGRADAYAEHYGDRMHRCVPASTGVGSKGDRLTIFAISSRLGAEHHENPRQISAYRYPQQYGPQPPSFARATLMPAALGGQLLIAGTASIVGHESLHAGDLLRQLDETLRNIETLLDGAAIERGAATRERLEFLKVYVRHREQLPAIRAALEGRLGGGVPLLFVEADICRAELLLEIEGVSRAS